MKKYRIVFLIAFLMLSYAAKSQESYSRTELNQLRKLADSVKPLRAEVAKRDSTIANLETKYNISNSRVLSLTVENSSLQNSILNKDNLHLKDISKLNRKLKVQKGLKWGFLALPPLGYMGYKLLKPKLF